MELRPRRLESLADQPSERAIPSSSVRGGQRSFGSCWVSVTGRPRPHARQSLCFCEPVELEALLASKASAESHLCLPGVYAIFYQWHGDERLFHDDFNWSARQHVWYIGSGVRLGARIFQHLPKLAAMCDASASRKPTVVTRQDFSFRFVATEFRHEVRAAEDLSIELFRPILNLYFPGFGVTFPKDVDPKKP